MDLKLEIRKGERLADQLYGLRKGTMRRASVDYAQFAETGRDFYEDGTSRLLIAGCGFEIFS